MGISRSAIARIKLSSTTDKEPTVFLNHNLNSPLLGAPNCFDTSCATFRRSSSFPDRKLALTDLPQSLGKEYTISSQRLTPDFNKPGQEAMAGFFEVAIEMPAPTTAMACPLSICPFRSSRREALLFIWCLLEGFQDKFSYAHLISIAQVAAIISDWTW